MKKKLLTLILSLLTALTITSFPANMAGISILSFHDLSIDKKD